MITDTTVATRYPKPICYNSLTKLTNNLPLRLDIQNQYAIIKVNDGSNLTMLRLDIQNQYAIIEDTAACLSCLLRLDIQNQYAIITSILTTDSS